MFHIILFFFVTLIVFYYQKQYKIILFVLFLLRYVASAALFFLCRSWVSAGRWWWRDDRGWWKNEKEKVRPKKKCTEMRKNYIKSIFHLHFLRVKTQESFFLLQDVMMFFCVMYFYFSTFSWTENYVIIDYYFNI